MKNISQALEDSLLEYIDGTLGDADVQALEEKLLQSQQLRNRLDELRGIDAMLTRTAVYDEPSMQFTGNVMQRLAHAPSTAVWSIKRALMLLCGVITAVGIASLLMSYGAFDGNTTLNLNQVALPKEITREPLPMITFNGKLIVNIIILINIVLGWILLDRTILKPYFQRRMQSGH